MKISRYLCLALVLACVSCEARDPSNSEASSDASALLSVTIAVEQRQGKNIGQAMLANKSSDFLCVSARVFDPEFQHILLRNKDGSVVRLKSVSEPSIGEFLGFDYSDAYLFIRPGEKRSVDFDLLDFQIEPGFYDYEVTFEYYRCRDVIDSTRIDARREISALSVQGSGEVQVLQEP